jgi:hypothetical protein
VIVISGALVLVALVLLVIGLVSTALSFVYASIAVSVVSFAFLLVGILQRRGEQLPDTEPGTASPRVPAPAAVTGGDGLTAIIPAGRGSRGTADATETADTADTAETAETADTAEAPETVEATESSRPEDGTRETAEAAEVAKVPEDGAQDAPGRVLVVAGRPRYHAASCRYLTGKDADEVEAAAARAEGFTACGVCKPDETSAAPETAAAPRTRKTTAKAAPATRSTATRSAASRSTAAVSAPPAKTARKAPAKSTAATGSAGTAGAAGAAGTAATSPRRAGGVVVIPDRGKFHRAACRYVRDVPGAQELTKAQATRQGYDACGVCKP